MAVPDSSPRASAVVSVWNPQRLMLADGTFFPPGCGAVPWGRTSAPAGVALKPCRTVGDLARFFHSVCQCARRQFQPASTVFQPASPVPYTHIDTHPGSVHIQEV
jgi:hypothetical protein